MRDEAFESDDEKGRQNFERHSVSFAPARHTFDDPAAREYDDDRYSPIGLAIDGLIPVTFTYRGHRIRIIAARGVERHERRLYHEGRRNGP